MAVFSRFASIALAIAGLAFGIGATAAAQGYDNPHLSAIADDSTLHYQLRLNDLIAAQQITGSQQGMHWMNSVMAAETMDPHDELALVTGLERLFAEGPDRIEEEIGIDPDGWITAYHAGLAGFLRVDIASLDRLLGWLDSHDIALEQPTEDSVAGGTLYALVDQPVPEVAVYLWMSGDTALGILAPPRMSIQALADRIETGGPTLAESGRVDELKDRYGFTGSDLFWLDHHGLVRALIGQEEHRLSQDLMKFSPDFRASLNDPVLTQCAAEIEALVATAPRIVYGQTAMATDDDALALTMRGALEVADDTLRQEFAAVEGRLPRYLSEQTDSLMGVGLALNMAELGDNLMTWRDRVVQADWTCPGLVDFQTEMAQTNLAAMMAGAGMLQGARGAVFEVFDMDFSAGDDIDALDALDVLLAIQADDPTRLARTLGELMSLPADFQVPTDGESATLPLPDAPLQVRISGDYLVVYSGDQARARALSLADAEHVNALLSASVDLPTLMQRLEDMPSEIHAQPATGGMNLGDACEVNQLITDQFSQFDRFQVSGTVATDEFGISLTHTLDAELGAPLDAAVEAGTYQLEYFEDCEWFDIGEDRLGSDGQAEYTQNEQGCSVHEERFDWWVEDNALVWGEREGRYRDSCQDDFSSWEPVEEAVRCQIVRTRDDGGFQCVSQDEYSMRYRYRPVH